MKVYLTHKYSDEKINWRIWFDIIRPCIQIPWKIKYHTEDINSPLHKLTKWNAQFFLVWVIFVRSDLSENLSKIWKVGWVDKETYLTDIILWEMNWKEQVLAAALTVLESRDEWRGLAASLKELQQERERILY